MYNMLVLHVYVVCKYCMCIVLTRVVNMKCAVPTYVHAVCTARNSVTAYGLAFELGNAKFYTNLYYILSIADNVLYSSIL